MSNPTCETCRWWLNLPDFILIEGEPPTDFYGECRRLPPVGSVIGDFPLTQIEMWCGEHSPKPENPK